MDDQLQFCSVEEAVEEIRQGRMIIVTDDPGRENEADLIIAAEFAAPTPGASSAPPFLRNGRTLSSSRS